MEERRGEFVHPLAHTPRAGSREIRMRPPRSFPAVRGKEE